MINYESKHVEYCLMKTVLEGEKSKDGECEVDNDTNGKI